LHPFALARYGKQEHPASDLPEISQEMLAEMVGTTRSRTAVWHNGRQTLPGSVNGGLDVLLGERLQAGECLFWTKLNWREGHVEETREKAVSFSSAAPAPAPARMLPRISAAVADPTNRTDAYRFAALAIEDP